MNITEWFDPYNVEHVRAYRDLQLWGMWPKGFIPDGMEMEPAWHSSLAFKMADAWIDEVLAGHVMGIEGEE